MVSEAPEKLHGRAFYESIGSPKYVLAPMVNQSEFAWRMLTRSFLPESERCRMLAYTPMLHARLFVESPKYRDTSFEPLRAPIRTESEMKDVKQKKKKRTNPVSTAEEAQPGTLFLDGNPAMDRPLFVQFCANDADHLLAAAKLVAPYCDAVDLNLGCPQGIARKGRYGAFLQEEPELIHGLVRTLHEKLAVPVTAKIRVLETREATLAYARMLLDAGASILTVHGRRRDQKGHLTGLADWAAIRHLRDNLPPETVIFANGNVLGYDDLQRCLEATGADAVMSAEGNLSDPSIFVPPPPCPGEDKEGEYWRGRDGRGGWRVDAVVRRYLDILHRYVLGQEPPVRRALFTPGHDEAWLRPEPSNESDGDGPRAKKRKTEHGRRPKASDLSPNLTAVQAHLFHLLRHFVSRHTDVRDALAKSRLGDMASYEAVLEMVERRVAEGLLEYERSDGASIVEEWRRDEAKAAAKAAAAKAAAEPVLEDADNQDGDDDPESSAKTVRECRRPWWVVQPIVRPLPKEALARGALTVKGAKTKPRKSGGTAVQDGVSVVSQDDVSQGASLHASAAREVRVAGA